MLPQVTAVETTSEPDTMAVAALSDPVASLQIPMIGNVALTAVTYVSSSCNRLCGGHFCERRSLGERASHYYEYAPDEGSWTTIDEHCL